MPTKPKTNTPKPAKAKFCTNCSQAVSGATAAVAVNVNALYCCRCRFHLDVNGKCQNSNCEFYQYIPVCI